MTSSQRRSTPRSVSRSWQPAANARTVQPPASIVMSQVADPRAEEHAAAVWRIARETASSALAQGEPEGPSQTMTSCPAASTAICLMFDRDVLMIAACAVAAVRRSATRMSGRMRMEAASREEPQVRP